MSSVPGPAAVRWTTDQRTFKVRLKDGWTFSNGQKVTSDSFIDAWNYAALVTFTLDDDSGVLTLGEVGVACGAGPTFLKGPLFVSFGNPRSWSGTWQVLGGTGPFDGLTGSGADTGLTAGAAVKATYKGTLED